MDKWPVEPVDCPQCGSAAQVFELSGDSIPKGERWYIAGCFDKHTVPVGPRGSPFAAIDRWNEWANAG